MSVSAWRFSAPVLIVVAACVAFAGASVAVVARALARVEYALAGATAATYADQLRRARTVADSGDAEALRALRARAAASGDVLLLGDSAAPTGSALTVTPAERHRLFREDRALVAGSGWRRAVSHPLKDRDEWDIVGVVLVPVRPWRQLRGHAALLTIGAVLSTLLGLVAVARIARRADASARAVASLAAAAPVTTAAVEALMLATVVRAIADSRGVRAAELLRPTEAWPLALTDSRVIALLLVVIALCWLSALLAAVWLASASRRPARVRETLAGWGFLAPSLSHLLLFSIGPLLFTLYLSLHRWDLLDPEKPFIGVANYRELLHDPLFWNALRNTAVYSLYVPATMVLALATAIVLDQQLPGIRALRTIVFLPFVASYVAIAIVWQWVFNFDYGLLNYFLGFLDVAPIDWLGNPSTALPAVMLVSAWVWLGYQMVIYLAGLQGIPPSLYEAARLDGAGAWQRFRYITLPMLRPVSVYVFVTGVIWSFHSFTLVYVMTEGGPVHATDVMVYHIYQNAWEFRRMGYAAALSWVLFALLLVLTLLQWRLLTRKVEHA